jgi:hypothetical protein
MMMNGAYVVQEVQRRAPELAGKWGTFLPPARVEGGEVVTKGHSNTFHVMEASPHKQEAIRFLNFFLTRGPSDGLSYADHFALIQQTINWTRPFLDYAYVHYDSLMTPFLDATLLIHPPLKSPQWQPFAELHARAAVQDMVQGRAGVEETHRRLHDVLASMHNGQ